MMQNKLGHLKDILITKYNEHPGIEVSLLSRW